MTRDIDERKRWVALIVPCLGVLMIVLDTTIVNVALPSIRADLGFTENSLVWVVNAYILTFGGFLLLSGRLGDLFGHRKLFLLVLGSCVRSASWRNIAISRAPPKRSSSRHPGSACLSESWKIGSGSACSSERRAAWN